jgi:hypothetical protein
MSNEEAIRIVRAFAITDTQAFVSERKAILQVVNAVEKAEKQLSDLLRILENVYCDLSDNFDIVDGDYGEPRPNSWMSVGVSLAHDVRRRTGHDITSSPSKR